MVTSADRPVPVTVSASYVRCLVTRAEISALLLADEDRAATRRTIFHIWPDYVIRPQIDRSTSTVKADAAGRTYSADGSGVVWAVLDTGIEAGHPHFAGSEPGGGTLDHPSVAGLHADFSWIVRNEPEPVQPGPGTALTDDDGHGTHVAGIIAGRCPDDLRPLLAMIRPGISDADLGLPQWQARPLDPGRTLAGMAPKARLVSLKVMDAGSGQPKTTSAAVIAAMEYVRRRNAWGRVLQIHGVNLSLGCPWYHREYAAGQSPLCRELNLLVGTGVVAVVSAGNGGFAESGDPHGMLSTITDPGNADRAITVGSTHRDRPHTFGVTYGSSKGPTLDGRLKPDLLAPGERITSCCAGKFRQGIPVFGDQPDGPCYAEDSGTSMAAPHVSGVIAAFLSVRNEYIGLPDEVKRIFTDSAVSLGRDRFFEGHGLVDLMGALARI
ncbi:serine peptidase [Actinoplanes sp. OR16]|uniref:S8 family peptidase n=1 Tax=Actinoplanes sp. OR16 TaxID=946334 RepID=UPI000F6B9211|nr:S8 family peptidase [Actinoplanes sp. OR16]BBH69223.1 serine peptidase [Actinoplanes sp. OR16]